MAPFKCRTCGGDIEADAGGAYGRCDHCGAVAALPRAADEQKVNLFNRANHLRRKGEFDQAVAAYESILNLDGADSEAHWGLALSKHGIEYVEDAASGRLVPTCHRLRGDSILADIDYLAALESAPDGYTRGLYEEEAKRISEMQKGILAISLREEPYDVFICYKETTDGGSRTKDSALAQDVYYQLAKEGFRVFFSRITLEDKLGHEYEPYIFAALNSARVMLVIGTEPANFNAVWVRNEWSRFLALMKKDRGRLLIPCYRDMDPYDLPTELSMLQSQDMSKIGFMQDLVRGVKKVLDGGNRGAAAPASGAAPARPSAAETLLERAFIVLEDEEWKKADELLEQALNLDPKNPRAYVGKLLVKLELPFENDLPAKAVTLNISSLTEYKDYEKALRFADPAYRRVLEGYEKARQEIILEKRYQKAVRQMESAVLATDFSRTAGSFAALSGYKDADALAKKCLELEAELIAELKAREQREYEEEEEYRELEQRKREEREREKEKERESMAREQRYQEAVALMNSANMSKDFKALAETFLSLVGYKNAGVLYAKCSEEEKRLSKMENRQMGNLVCACFVMLFISWWLKTPWGCLPWGILCLVMMGAMKKRKRSWPLWIPVVIMLVFSWQCGGREQPDAQEAPSVAVETPTDDHGDGAIEETEPHPGH